jgi:hypothetical protein
MDPIELPPWAEDVSNLLPTRDGASKSRAIEKMARSFHAAPGAVGGGGG